MRRIAIIAATAALVGLGSVPAHAGVRADVRHSAKVTYRAAAKRFGVQAVGRDIARHGVRTKRGERPATVRELRRWRETLVSMLHPAPAPVVTAAAASVSTVTTAASPSPAGYCGAYQFDQQTWNSVGGQGSPCAASPAEQDRRAEILLQQRGTEPWPHCGSRDLAAIRQCENGGSYG